MDYLPQIPGFGTGKLPPDGPPNSEVTAMLGLFVTGTDTNVGKTWMTCRLIRAVSRRGFKVGAYKPVCTGSVELSDGRSSGWEDVERLFWSLEGEYPRQRICPQCFAAPLAPPAAAAEEGRQVDEPLLCDGIDWWRDRVDLLVVEGVGGWKCPLTASATIADFALQLGFPVLIVAANRLGVLSHSLLTVESVQLAGLRVAGIVLNCTTANADPSADGNLEQLRRRVSCPVWGPVPFDDGEQLQPWPGFDTINVRELFGRGSGQ